MNVEEYSSRYNEIAGQLMAKCYEEHAGENIVLSPFSVLMALAIAAYLTSGDTRKEITDFICEGASFEDILLLLRNIQNYITEDGVANVVNAVMINDSLAKKVDPIYAGRIRKVFDGEMISSDNIVEDVNHWVKEKTKGAIDNIVDDTLKDMLLCLINAITFGSRWLKTYEITDLTEHEFTNADGSKGLASMLMCKEYGYVDTEDFVGFSKPYRDGGFSYMALLSKSLNSGIDSELLSKIDYTKLFFGKRPGATDVLFPEYKCEMSYDLKSPLEKINICSVFRAGADFSKFSAESLMIDIIVHQACIEVDRRGTKASTVTAALGDRGLLMPEKHNVVCLDRPFIYAIMHNETRLPIFTGVVNNVNYLDDGEVEDRRNSRLDSLKMDADEANDELTCRYREIKSIAHPDYVKPRGFAEAGEYERLWIEAMDAYKEKNLVRIREIHKDVEGIRKVGWAYMLLC